MWIIGLLVLAIGGGYLAWGAMPRDDNSPSADAAIRRGAVLIPIGLGLMFSDAPLKHSGIPREFFGAYVVASSLLTALVVIRFSEDRNRDDDPEQTRSTARRRAQERLGPDAEAPPVDVRT